MHGPPHQNLKFPPQRLHDRIKDFRGINISIIEKQEAVIVAVREAGEVETARQRSQHQQRPRML